MSCLETQLGNKKKTVCQDGLGQGTSARLLPALLMCCEGCSVPHHHGGMSPGELCWWWLGQELSVLSYNREQMGCFTPFTGM